MPIKKKQKKNSVNYVSVCVTCVCLLCYLFVCFWERVWHVALWSATYGQYDPYK